MKLLAFERSRMADFVCQVSRELKNTKFGVFTDTSRKNILLRWILRILLYTIATSQLLMSQENTKKRPGDNLDVAHSKKQKAEDTSSTMKSIDDPFEKIIEEANDKQTIYLDYLKRKYGLRVLKDIMGISKQEYVGIMLVEHRKDHPEPVYHLVWKIRQDILNVTAYLGLLSHLQNGSDGQKKWQATLFKLMLRNEKTPLTEGELWKDFDEISEYLKEQLGVSFSSLEELLQSLGPITQLCWENLPALGPAIVFAFKSYI
jgi:hypothetical protein